MHAVIVRCPGGVDALELEDVPVPEPARGQVRIRVHAAAVNPVDLGTRSGHLVTLGLVARDQPLALGWDVAGIVQAVGPEVVDFAPGLAVIGLRDVLSAPVGTQAEQVVLDATAVARAPRAASLVEAATLPLNGLTALQALDLAELRFGDTLLVTGAAGGLGGYLVELGTLRGLRVIAVAAPEDEALVRELGAAEFVPRSSALGQAVRAVIPGGVDGAIDAAVVGIAALDAVRGGGAYISVVPGAAPWPLRGIRVRNVWIRADGGQLAQLAALADAGRLTLRVADTLPLAEVATAHERIAMGGLRGRIVLTP